MAKPWETLFNAWNSIFTRDLSEESPDPKFLSGAGIGRSDAVGSSEYLEGGSTFNHAVQITSLNDFLEIGEHTDRRARYLEYDRMENIAEISSALNTFSDEITVPDINGKVFNVFTKNDEIKKEANWFFRKVINIETESLWSWARNLCKNGDLFLEMVMDPNNPHFGIQKIAELPPETMYRIETVKGTLIEFQQSYQGPDYQVVIQSVDGPRGDNPGRMPDTSPTTTTGTINGSEMMKATQVIRFSPDQIVHARIGMKRRGFYPYGVSILYAGRRVAHLLKLMEDAMLVYRLTRSPERKVFFIDIGTTQPHKGEMILERIRDKIKKKKIYNSQTGQIDERYNPWAIDEDYFLPVRPDSNTRIETLPGACLAMNTLIPLIDGRILTIKEIADEYVKGKVNWAYSCNPKTGDIVPGLISWAGVTQEQAKVVKLTFENNKSIICTLDHKFPIIGKGKTRADQLEIDDKIFSINNLIKTDENIQNYSEFYDKKTSSWKHYLISKENNKIIFKEIFDDRNKKYNYNINHDNSIKKIEYLDEEIQVGTLTIDGVEIFHDYHTFAINDIGFTYNSNLGEIDDVKYFREKLMMSLSLPKNYLFQEDSGLNRTSYASQDMRFARTIYRIQKVLEDTLMNILIKHLSLKGFTREDLLDIDVKFTSPSDWLELSRSEVLSNKYNLAASIKGSQLYDQFTILTRILDHTEEESKEIIQRLDQEQLRAQELQAQAQIFSTLTNQDKNQEFINQDVKSLPQSELEKTQMQNQLPQSNQEQGVEINPEINTEINPETSAEITPEIETKNKKSKRFKDFIDLETDQEEIDSNY